MKSSAQMDRKSLARLRGGAAHLWRNIINRLSIQRGGGVLLGTPGAEGSSSAHHHRLEASKRPLWVRM